MLWLRFLHLLAVFGFVSGQITGDLVSRALRKRTDPGARLALVEVAVRAFWMLQLAGLLLAAIFGNLLATSKGERMTGSPWLQQANGLFLLMALALLLGVRPMLRRLQQAARGPGTAHGAALGGAGPPSGTASTGTGPADFERARRRWYLWHSVLDLLYLVTIARMVWR